MADPRAKNRPTAKEKAPLPEEPRSFGSRLKAIMVETRSVMPAADGAGLSLILVIAAMCFLASLSLGAALTVGRTSANWARDLSGALTIEVKPSDAMPQDAQVDAVLKLLSETQGVLGADALSKADTEALLEPWLGKGNVTEDLPLPRLVDVRIDPNTPPDMEALAQHLTEVAPGAVLDTHRQWQTELVRAARSAQWLAYAVLAVVAATTIAIVTFATRSGLSANREVVEVLHMIGARDKFIASEVQRHFLHLGLRGGIIGLALSVATFAGIAWYGQSANSFLLPVSSIPLEFYPALAGVPIVAALVAMITARITVLRTLHRLL